LGLQVCLGKFHSVWICEAGEAWGCGQLARAGGPHSTALQPVPLRLPDRCLQAAITLNSTIFLLEGGTVSLQFAIVLFVVACLHVRSFCTFYQQYN
jgi:hypothetical protein